MQLVLAITSMPKLGKCSASSAETFQGGGWSRPIGQHQDLAEIGVEGSASRHWESAGVLLT